MSEDKIMRMGRIVTAFSKISRAAGDLYVNLHPAEEAEAARERWAEARNSEERLGMLWAMVDSEAPQCDGRNLAFGVIGVMVCSAKRAKRAAKEWRLHGTEHSPAVLEKVENRLETLGNLLSGLANGDTRAQDMRDWEKALLAA